MQYRNYNFAGDLQQLLLSKGIGYNLTENNNNILLGYGFINGQTYTGNGDEKISSNEHSVYQQFITSQKFSHVYLQHRLRIEERFLTDDFLSIFRYFLSMNVPLNNKEILKNTVYLSAYN